MNAKSWCDLAATTHRQTDVEADVCIIGAGAAGIYLSKRLAQQGYSVVLVDAGPTICVDSSTVGFDAICSGDRYPGATSGRFFGLGGSTSHWGGLLVPHTDLDRRCGGASEIAWARIVGVVGEKTPAVLRELGYAHRHDFEGLAEGALGETAGTLAGCGIRAQAGLYLPFGRKNMVRLLGRVSGRTAGPRVFFNAVAKNWLVQASDCGGAHIQQLVAVSRNNNQLRVSAGKFVIAAGAVESARILLEMNGTGPQHVLRQTALPGCYLGDHLSMPIADIVQDSLDRTASLFAPRFFGGWMHGLRLLESAPPPDAPRAFAHFIFATRSRGFDLAKALLGAAQQRRMPRVAMADVAGGFSDLARLAYGRFVASRLYIPVGTPAHLQLDIEQIPARDNRVRLTDQRDDYGRRVAGIHWQVSTADMAAMATTAQRLFLKWLAAKAGLPALRPRMIAKTKDGDGTKPYDAYHPVGTCRMGEDPEAVVDYNLKVWGVDNLWVVSTGVLPSAGTANPTFTMLCLAHWLGDHFKIRQ